MALVVPSLLLAQISFGGMGKHIYDCTYHELYVSHLVQPIMHSFVLVPTDRCLAWCIPNVLSFRIYWGRQDVHRASLHASERVHI